MPSFDKPTAARSETRALFTQLDEEISELKISITELEQKLLQAFSCFADMLTAAQNQCQALSSLRALSSVLDEEISKVKISLTNSEEDLAKLKSIFMPPESADMPPAAQNQREAALDLFTLLEEGIGQAKISMKRIEENMAKVTEIMAEFRAYLHFSPS